MFVEMEMHRNANVKKAIAGLYEAVRASAGPDAVAKLTITVNVHRDVVKIVASTEEVIDPRAA